MLAPPVNPQPIAPQPPPPELHPLLGVLLRRGFLGGRGNAPGAGDPRLGFGGGFALPPTPPPAYLPPGFGGFNALPFAPRLAPGVDPGYGPGGYAGLLGPRSFSFRNPPPFSGRDPAYSGSPGEYFPGSPPSGFALPSNPVAQLLAHLRRRQYA